MTKATTVRVNRATHLRLKALASQTHSSITEVVAAAVRAYHKKLFFEQADRDYLALREDPEAWEEHQQELR